MSKIKSPFYIIPELISPKKCDEFLSKIAVSEPNKNLDGTPVMLTRKNEELEQELFQKFKEYIPAIEKHFNCKHIGTTQMDFQMLPENPKTPAIAAGCQNSKYLRKKWVKVADVDLTVILWLKDYHDSVPLDPRTEVYGGKLEFPVYKFSFTPQRGTAVVYPAGPHFISVTSPVLVSDSYQVSFNITIRNVDDGIWLYQPQNFAYDKKRGMIESWFNDHLG